MTIIVGVDAGNHNIKLYGDRGALMFPSAIGEYRERKLEQRFSEHDIVFEYEDQKGFAGTLAEYESQFSATRMGDSKAHKEMLIRVLIGLHRYSNDATTFKIVVGQPISKHTKLEKEKMKEMLEGTHLITVNGKEKEITIERAEVAAEGGSAFWALPRKGKVRVLDIGSGTVNGATLIDGRYIDKDSFTLKDGLGTLLSDDVDAFVRKISLHALKSWDVDDLLILCGGGAETVFQPLHEYFTNIEMIVPQMRTRDNEGAIVLKKLSPIYANAVGFYNIAKKVM